MQHHNDQLHAVLLGIVHLCVQGLIVPAGFRALHVRPVHLIGFPAGVIRMAEIALLRLNIGGLHRPGVLIAEHGFKAGLLQRPAGDHRHIPGGGVQLLIVQAGGVGKMRVGKAQLLRLIVHGLHTALNAAAHIGGQHIGGIAGRRKAGGVQHILQPHFLAGAQRNVGGAVFHGVHFVLGHGQHGVPVALRLFAGKAQDHNFGDGGRIQNFIRVFFDQHLPGAALGHNIGLAVGGHRGSPLGSGRHGQPQGQRGSQHKAEKSFYLQCFPHKYSMASLREALLPHKSAARIQSSLKRQHEKKHSF